VPKPEPEVAPALVVQKSFACALAPDGSVWCWGSNSSGRLGDGTVEDRAVPVRVQGLPRARGLALGLDHACAVGVEGRVWCWGANSYGELGDGTRRKRPRPARVEGLPRVRQVAAGTRHVCVLAEDETVWCWGANSSGEVSVARKEGTVPRPLRVAAPERPRGLFAGYDRTCVVDDVGAAWCWGRDDYRKTSGAKREGPSPLVRVPGVERVASVHLAPRATWAVRRDGQVHRWGDAWLRPHRYGLGAAPTLVEGRSGVRAVAQGEGHECLLYNDGTVACLGHNESAQLGFVSDGKLLAKPRPVAGLKDVVALGASGNHTCALDASARVWCWGERAAEWAKPKPGAPVKVDGLKGIAGVSAGGYETCARAEGGDLWCWGCKRRQLLGGVASVSVGASHSCAVLEDGSSRCWGEGGCCQLGRGSAFDSEDPVAPKGPDDVAQIAAGARHTCAVTKGGVLFCWGEECDNDLHHQGMFSATQAYGAIVPKRVHRPSKLHAVAVSAGDRFSCVLARAKGAGEAAEHQVECLHSQSGMRELYEFRLPVTEPVQVAVAGDWGCARRIDGSVWCWNASLHPKIVPGLVGTTHIDVSRRRGCAVVAGGEVRCWKRPDEGLGDDDWPDDDFDLEYDAAKQPIVIPEPVPVAGIKGARYISVGAEHACVVDGGGEVWCWGDVAHRTLGSQAFSNGGGALLVLDLRKPPTP